MAHQSQIRRKAAYEPLHPALSSPEIELAFSAGLPPHDGQPTLSSDRYEPLRAENKDTSDTRHQNQSSDMQGLGLLDSDHYNSPKIKRVPVGTNKRAPISATYLPQSNESPPYVLSQPTTVHNILSRSNNDDIVTWPSPQSPQPSLKSQDNAYRSTPSDVNLLHREQSFGQGCPTSGDVLRTRWSWYCYAIIFLAVFSTLFSGIFLGIALRKPRWNGLKRFPIETATLLSALFSKLIELSFACVFVATLGQILSRKAFEKRLTGQSGGVSIAEMNMRLWILQPGSLLTHWTGAWFALKTMLGIVVLLAAFAAALYITAAEALVSPKLSFGKNETRELVGKFSTMYANARYLDTQCETPITKAEEQDEEGPVCMQIEYAGQSYRNFGTWLTNWGEKVHSPHDLDPPDWRPPPVAMMFDNTTVQGQWIFSDKDNISVDSERFGRLVHNVTLAMPHANVVHAVRDARNQILQPEDLRGDGEYYVEAAVPAPILNVLCVGMSDSDIKPMITNSSNVPAKVPFSTSVDDIFGFKQNPDDEIGDNAPWFPRKPADLNTILNKTRLHGNKAIYMLSASPPTIDTANYTLCAIKSSLYPHCTTSYHVAQSGSELTVHCDDGRHHVKQNSLPYSKFNPLAPVGVWSADWTWVGDTWASSVALGQGISDANAAISRTLLQMTPKYSSGSVTTLDPKFPTLSEGLGVLAGSTLLISSDNSPFAHMWNYTGQNHFNIPQDQYFASLLSYKDYVSGNNAPWQGLFYVVLLAVFLLNLFCLCYLLWKFYTDGEVTDYTEPQNLFALAINSPPSHMMSGSCGPGPDGNMLRKKWTVDIALSSPKQIGSPSEVAGGQETPGPAAGDQSADVHPHFYVRCSEDDPDHMGRHWQHQANEASELRRRKVSFAANGRGSPLYQTSSAYAAPRPTYWPSLHMVSSLWDANRFSLGGRSKQKTRPRSVSDPRLDDPRMEDSPALEQYKRLTGRR